MQQNRNLRQVGDRIEMLLEELRTTGDEPTREKAEDLVGLLVELYGAGLERIVEIIASDERVGPHLLSHFADDELVASLLILHGLHPLDVETRVQKALDKVRPYLGSHAGGVEFLDVDEAGVVHLRLEGSCHGCPSSTITVKLAIERAIMEAAPEVTRIDVEGVAERQTGQVISLDSLRKNGHKVISGAKKSPADDWSTIAAVKDVRSGHLTTEVIDGEDILLCRLDADFYAYRNACAACGGPWEAGRIAGKLLACPTCGEQYDVRLAGRSPERQDLHLIPLPLLADDGAVRVALLKGDA